VALHHQLEALRWHVWLPWLRVLQCRSGMGSLKRACSTSTRPRSPARQRRRPRRPHTPRSRAARRTRAASVAHAHRPAVRHRQALAAPARRPRPALAGIRLHPLPWALPIPVRVHGHYSRAEIEAAHCCAEASGYGILRDDAPWIHREGVLRHEPSQTDLLFVTRPGPGPVPVPLGEPEHHHRRLPHRAANHPPRGAGFKGAAVPLRGSLRLRARAPA
jgi:hypothetical protein